MQHDGAARSPASGGERVLVGRARVDDDRQPELRGERELSLEEPRWRLAGRVVAEVVEPGLPHRDGAPVARAARASSSSRPASAPAALWGWTPRLATTPVVAVRRARAPRGSPRSSSRRRSPASTPAARARASTAVASAGVEVGVGVDHARPSSSSATDGSSLRKSGSGSPSAWPGGSSLGSQRADPARVVAGQHLVARAVLLAHRRGTRAGRRASPRSRAARAGAGWCAGETA